MDCYSVGNLIPMLKNKVGASEAFKPIPSTQSKND